MQSGTKGPLKVLIKSVVGKYYDRIRSCFLDDYDENRKFSTSLKAMSVEVIGLFLFEASKLVVGGLETIKQNYINR